VKRHNCLSMKKLNVFFFPQLIGKVLVLILALLIVACAGTSIAATHNTPTPTQNISPTEATEATAVPGAVEVKVSLIEFRIISSVTVFHAGIPYHFVISNRGQDIHEFMIMPDKPDGTPQPPDVQFKGMLMELEPIMPGTTWTVNYTFSPAATGRFEIACQMRGHYKAGMRLPIVVTS
jgi:uncharacterized cupredoxin-like copper-binding protein